MIPSVLIQRSSETQVKVVFQPNVSDDVPSFYLKAIIKESSAGLLSFARCACATAPITSATSRFGTLSDSLDGTASLRFSFLSSTET